MCLTCYSPLHPTQSLMPRGRQPGWFKYLWSLFLKGEMICLWTNWWPSGSKVRTTSALHSSLLLRKSTRKTSKQNEKQGFWELAFFGQWFLLLSISILTAYGLEITELHHSKVKSKAPIKGQTTWWEIMCLSSEMDGEGSDLPKSPLQDMLQEP